MTNPEDAEKIRRRITEGLPLYHDHQRKILEILERYERLRHALRAYGQHRPECPGTGCTCGLLEARGL